MSDRRHSISVLGSNNIITMSIDGLGLLSMTPDDAGRLARQLERAAYTAAEGSPSCCIEEHYNRVAHPSTDLVERAWATAQGER